MSLRPFDAIIFDHDGTLVDTESPDFRACCMLYEELGLTLQLEYWAEHVVGRLNGYEVLFQELIQRDGHGQSMPVLRQRLRELWDVTFQNVKLMPGVLELLPQLRQAGYPLAVATGADRAWVQRWLTHFSLQSYFGVVANSEDVPHNKPAPDVYLFAAGRLGVQPERCLVFEDSLAGVQAAKAAGMTAVAVPSEVTKTLNFSQADAVITGLRQVTPAWIEAIGKIRDRQS